MKELVGSVLKFVCVGRERLDDISKEEKFGWVSGGQGRVGKVREVEIGLED